jgi:hypothetical protein
MDYDLLRTLNFTRYRPRLIVTEEYEPTNVAKAALLEAAGYACVERLGCNTFWMEPGPSGESSSRRSRGPGGKDDPRWDRRKV